MGLKFNIDEWLTAIDVWDEKYDYIMHNSHWLTSDWCSNCQKCLAKGKKPAPITTTSSPMKISTSLNSTDPTLKYENHKADVASPPPPLADTIIPVTPIAPSHAASNRAFVTPLTSNKFNDTFTRSTRQTTRKLLNQTANQDLISLNETFDLYKSALADTPSSVSEDERQLLDLAPTTNGSPSAKVPSHPSSTNIILTSPLSSTGGLLPPKPRSNFELLTSNQNNGNHHFNPTSLQEVDNNHEYSQPVTSRIPRIPLRTSRNHDY